MMRNVRLVQVLLLNLDIFNLHLLYHTLWNDVSDYIRWFPFLAIAFDDLSQLFIDPRPTDIDVELLEPLHDLPVEDVQLPEILHREALQALAGQLRQVKPLSALNAQVGCQIEKGQCEYLAEWPFCEHALH